MLKNLFTFIFFVLISFEASSQNVKKAYKLYQKNELVKLKEVLKVILKSKFKGTFKR